MKQRGRKSAAALVVVPDPTGRPPPLVAPSSLTPEAREVWHRALHFLPAGWIEPEQADLLASYCHHVSEAERLRKAAQGDCDLPTFRALTSMALQQSALSLRFATALRLTPHARAAPISAGRRAAAPRVNARLWQRDEG